MTIPYDPSSQNQQFPEQEIGHLTPVKKTKSKALIAIISVVAFFGVIGISIIGVYAFNAFSGNTSGASNPEGVITNTFSALEKQDLLGAAKNMDPSEIAPFIENYSTFTDALERNEDIRDKEKPLESFEFEAKGLETKTVNYSKDVARVELLSGTITTSTDNSKLPDKDKDESGESSNSTETLKIIEANEQWRNGFGGDVAQSYAGGFGVNAPDIEFDEDALESKNIFYIAVNRDGRWYFSSLYTALEYGRILANANGADIERPSFDPDLRKGNGADSPEKAVEAMVENIFDQDAISKVFPPERLSVAYDFQGVKDRSNNDTFDVDFISDALKDSIDVKDLKTSVKDEGKDLQFVTIESLKLNFLFEPNIASTDSEISMFLPEKVDVDVNFDGRCVVLDGTYKSGFTGFDDGDGVGEDDGFGEDFSYLDSNDDETEDGMPASLQSANRHSENEKVSEKECLSDIGVDKLGVSTVKEDGKYYVSPIDTIWHYIIKAVKNI